MSERGLKIALEGIDGVGKSTQSRIVKQELERRGHNVYLKPCRNDFVSDGPDSDMLKILKEAKQDLRANPASQVLLQAARMSYLNNVYIEPELAAGNIVLCDRDVDTAIAYAMPDLRRHYPERSSRELIAWTAGVYAVGSTIPDLAIFLDTDTSVALERATADNNPNERAIFDEGGVAFINQVRGYYLEVHDAFPDRIKRIDIDEKPVDEVSEQLMDVIDEYITYSRER